MTRRLHIRPQAQLDLQAIAGQIAVSGIDVALDFWDAVEATYRILWIIPSWVLRLSLKSFQTHRSDASS